MNAFSLFTLYEGLLFVDQFYNFADDLNTKKLKLHLNINSMLKFNTVYKKLVYI